MPASSTFGGASENQDNRADVSGHSNLQGGAGEAAAQFGVSGSDQALVLGLAAQYKPKSLEAGAIDLQSNKGQLGGVQVGKKGTLTVNDQSVTNITTDTPGLVERFTSALADIVNKTTTATAASQSQTLDAIAGLAAQREKDNLTMDSAILEADQANQASADTNGFSRLQKTILVVVLAAFALGAFTIHRKKSA